MWGQVKQVLLGKSRDMMACWSLCWKWFVLLNCNDLFLFGVPGIKRPQIHAQHLLPSVVLIWQRRVNINQTQCKQEANAYFKNILPAWVGKSLHLLNMWEWLISTITTQWCSLDNFLPKTYVLRKMFLITKPALAEPAIGRTNRLIVYSLPNK